MSSSIIVFTNSHWIYSLRIKGAAPYDTAPSVIDDRARKGWYFYASGDRDNKGRLEKGRWFLQLRPIDQGFSWFSLFVFHLSKIQSFRFYQLFEIILWKWPFSGKLYSSWHYFIFYNRNVIIMAACRGITKRNTCTAIRPVDILNVPFVYYYGHPAVIFWNSEI